MNARELRAKAREGLAGCRYLTESDLVRAMLGWGHEPHTGEETRDALLALVRDEPAHMPRERILEELEVCGCDPDDCLGCSVPRKVREKLDRYDEELSEKYLKLPVDGNGVPIRTGDVIGYQDESIGPIDAMSVDGDGAWTVWKDGDPWVLIGDELHLRSVEDVLMDFKDGKVGLEEAAFEIRAWRDVERWIPSERWS